MIWGYNRLLSSLPGVPCGGVPAKRNHRAFGIFAFPKAGAERAAPPVLRGFAGRRGHFSRRALYRFPAGGRHRPRVPSLIKALVSSPFREVRGTGIMACSIQPVFEIFPPAESCLSVSAGGKHGRKCVPEALENHCVHRQLAFCAAAVGRSCSITRPNPARRFLP